MIDPPISAVSSQQTFDTVVLTSGSALTGRAL